jgi:hypothetical protein
MSDSNEKPKLHIEGDWKSEVQAEKQRLTDQAKPAEPAPKIEVPKGDSDWKAQAKAEKEKLARQADEAGDEQAGGRQMPPADFKTLISTMVTQAMMALGAIPDPQSGQRYVILDLARHHIDMLGVLEEKTKGNLDEEEQQMITQTLHELRLHFVQISKAAAEGRLGSAPGSEGGTTGQPRGPVA